jgi:hypothetical protein
MESVRTSETSVDNNFTRQYIPEDNSERHLPWLLALREDHRLRIFENMVLRRVFRPKGDEVTGEWKRVHNEELHNLYSSPDMIRQ